MNIHSFRRALIGCNGVSETQRLKYLNVVYEKDYDLNEARDHRHKVLRDMRAVLRLAEEGRVAIVFSGMDCDGVQYGGDVRYCPATIASARELIERQCASADGPIYWSVERPSVAVKISYRSRDRILEAFENGHAHSITYGSL
jgi:hypothetical protein